MYISLFNLFSIGIGPSSSHTVGPMKAACDFAGRAIRLDPLPQRIQVELFGSLAFTGRGHGTDVAVLLGLEGHQPDTIDPDCMKPRMQAILTEKSLRLGGTSVTTFNPETDLLFNFKETLPSHTNGMRFSAFDQRGALTLSEIYYSVGGGFILTQEEASAPSSSDTVEVPFPFSTTSELLSLCETHHLSIAELVLANESALRPAEEVAARLASVAAVMRASIDRGCAHKGILPGGLQVRRRAAMLHEKLLQKGRPASYELTDSMAWLNLYAIAVNEENAAGNRIVTAPTNGAAGVIPAVLNYWMDFYPEAKETDIQTFLLTAGAIAMLYKKGASISGAEVGCQGEVGVASSMAAGAFAALLGGSIQQVENAAEIAMEHHLGMTCDPIGGLVQIPCIERNAMGAVKAVNAARLALLGDGHHFVSLDKVIATMKRTGHDMMTIYKETSLGGLAANLPEC